MSHSRNNQPVINNLNDLAIVKERYRYEVKLREQSLFTNVNYVSSNLRATVKQTVNVALEKIIYYTIIKLIK